MRLVLFGVSNLLGDIFDCALARGLTPSVVVTNVPEVTRTRTASALDRIMRLPSPPRVVRLEDFSPMEGECYCLGTTSPQRQNLVEDINSRFGIAWCTLVHPTAYVAQSANLAEGVFIGAGAVIGSGAKLGEHVFVNRKVSVGHDTTVESYARLQPGCNIGGHARVGYGATVGIGATVIEEVEIGPGAVIAAGAVIIHDVPENTLVVGVPGVVKKTLS